MWLLYWAFEWPLAVSLTVLQLSTFFIRDWQNFCPSINWEISWKAPCVFITDDKLHTSWPIFFKIILRHTLHKKNNTYQVCLVNLLWFLRPKKRLVGFWLKENVKKFLVRALFRLRRFLSQSESWSGPGSSTYTSATVLVRARLRLWQFWFKYVVFCDSSGSSTLCSATVLVRLSRHQKALVRKTLKGTYRKVRQVVKRHLM